MLMLDGIMKTSFWLAMAADPTTGLASPVSGAKQPVDLGDAARPAVGYYGQFGREELLEQIPDR
mgnify:CR=1 FL=1